MTGESKGMQEPNRALARAGVPRAAANDRIKAVSAFQRRRILRALHEVGEARSPNELAKAFAIPVSHISYHVNVLRGCGAVALTDTQQKRGAVEHFYASTVAEDSLTIDLLEDTRADDDQAP